MRINSRDLCLFCTVVYGNVPLICLAPEFLVGTLHGALSPRGADPEQPPTQPLPLRGTMRLGPMRTTATKTRRRQNGKVITVTMNSVITTPKPISATHRVMRRGPMGNTATKARRRQKLKGHHDDSFEITAPNLTTAAQGALRRELTRTPATKAGMERSSTWQFCDHCP